MKESGDKRANELLEKCAGKKFGYNADKDLEQNGAAVASIESWLRNEGKTLRWEGKTGAFRAQR